MELRTTYEIMGWLNGVSRRYERAETQEEVNTIVERMKAERMVSQIDVYESLPDANGNEALVTKTTHTLSLRTNKWTEHVERYLNPKGGK